MTLLDKLRKVNDEYHEAVSEIFEDGDLPVELKTAFGVHIHRVFAFMAKAEDVIQEHYEPEE